MSTSRAGLALLVALATLLGLGIVPVAAADFRAAERVTVAAGETVVEDLYVAAATAVIDGTVDGDLTVAGGTVEVRGTVTGSINVAGGNVTVAGTVGGSVRAAGGTVTVSGSVARDVVITGGNVIIADGASVGADVAGAAGTLDITGNVEGDILASAGELVVRGTVGGGIDSQVGHLRIEGSASVAGDVRYGSDREAEIAPDAQIGGAVERTEPIGAEARPLIAENVVTVFLGSFLALLLLGWGLMLVRPSVVVGPGFSLRSQPLVAFAGGLMTWVGQVFVLIVLIVLAVFVGRIAASLGGAFLAPVALLVLAMIAAVLIAQVWVSMAIGGWLAGRTNTSSPWLAYALGAAVWVLALTILGLVTAALGAVIFLIGWILGLGAVTLYAVQTRPDATTAAVYADRSARPAAPAP
jgi:cytoskeletal protein CcmA (bactofilin family)